MQSEKYEYAFILSIRSLVKEKDNELTKFHLMVAAKNTWQALISGQDIWPYNKSPPMITGGIKTGTRKLTIISVNLDEHIWKYQKGELNLSECLNNRIDEGKCQSIFDPRVKNSEFR